MTYKRMTAVAGLIAWVMVGLPAFIYHTGRPGWSWGWVAAFIIFGCAFAADLAHLRPELLLAESAAAITLVLLRCNGYEGTLLVVLAMQLGSRFGRTTGLIWIGVQTSLLAAAVVWRLNPRAALLLAPPYFGFQLLAFFVFHTMAREMAMRIELATANAELRALQQVLGESSRMAERLRIAHELHDALGHRLTALTLNLEAALHCANGVEKPRLELCQSLARQLLSDVRDIVAQSNAGDGATVTQTLHDLVSVVPRPQVHLNIIGELRIFDPEAAHILLRCVQEITTNAARHSGARNLWIVIEPEGEALHLRAHDDGHGRDAPNDGFGLRGMRERVERAGGEIQFFTQPDRGFGVTAMLPLRSGTS